MLHRKQFKSFLGFKLSDRDKAVVKTEVTSKITWFHSGYPLVKCFMHLRPLVQTCHKTIHSTNNTNFICSIAFCFMQLAYHMYNKKASTVASPSNSSLSHAHNAFFNDNLCTKWGLPINYVMLIMWWKSSLVNMVCAKD